MVYKVVRNYSISLVHFSAECPNCSKMTFISVYSTERAAKFVCEYCEQHVELDIIVCPECNSSKFVNQTDNGPWCSQCEKLVLE